MAFYIWKSVTIGPSSRTFVQCSSTAVDVEEILLMIGKTLGHYEITDRLGKGGMGEVYRARDTKLNRDVALKVLPEEFANDPERMARFKREAQLLASLNHTSIAAIYGLEERGGIVALVMELAEGPTLADRISKGPIPLDEGLAIARQIAEALEAAHEKGIVHRDLKPANIKVAPDGQVKVLDFGLAKAVEGEATEADASQSPTLSLAATKAGLILGTAAYMSPEQARGKTVDKRTDIWAFGCVLFEMLAGQAAFQGEDVAEILASVVKGVANLDLLPENIHPRVKEVIGRCLQKDPKKRYRDIGDVQYDIEQTLEALGGPFVQPAPTMESRIGLRKLLAWVVAAAALGAIVTGVMVWHVKPSGLPPVTSFSEQLSPDQQFDDLMERILAVSPNGLQFIYATSKGLYLRSLDNLQAKLLSATAGNGQRPFFSRDGKWIGYFSSGDGQLKKIAVSGGAPKPLAKVDPDGSFDWNEDGSIVWGQRGKGIMRISADGGIPELVVKQGKNERFIHPQILPDGKSIMFSRIFPLPTMIIVQSLKSDERKELFEGDAARYLPTAHIVYGFGNGLYGVRFDMNALNAIGASIPLVEGIARTSGAPQYAISDSGTLAYMPGAASTASRVLVWVDRNGNEEAIEAEPRAYAYANLSPDEKRIALDIRDQENDIWIWDLARKNLSRFTFEPGMNRGGIWTPDGEKLAFFSIREGMGSIYWQAADGSGAPELLTKILNAPLLPNGFSPDGKRLLLTNISPPYHISVLNLSDGAEPKPLLKASAGEQANPQISHDGRWIAYQSNESGKNEIYVRSFPDVDNGGKWQVSNTGGTRPTWNPNGREIFYYLEPGTMMVVPVEAGTTFHSGTPKVLFSGEYVSALTGLQYSVSQDGQKFLMIKDVAPKPSGSAALHRINVVLNWIEELKKLVPVK